MDPFENAAAAAESAPAPNHIELSVQHLLTGLDRLGIATHVDGKVCTCSGPAAGVHAANDLALRPMYCYRLLEAWP